MYIRTALIGAVTLSTSLSALAQATDSEPTKLDTVIVEGSRLNQTQTEIGSSVSIVTAEEIDQLGVDFALDAIAAVPGVTIDQNGAFGGTASVRIRGAATGQTLVLIDGVPVNDPSSPGGSFDFARVDTENIERIEVLKGPQSTLWGTDAIGGVISIFTKRPEPGLGGTVFGEYGSFNTFRGGASVENGNDVGDFRLAVAGTRSDGISKADEDNGNDEDDAYDAVTVSAKGGLNLAGDARLSANLLWSDAESEFDSFVFGAQGNVGDGDNVSDAEELSGNISLAGTLFGDALDNLLMIGFSQIDRQNYSNGLPSFNARGDRMILRYQGTLELNSANTLAFGAEREETEFNDDETTIEGLFGLYEFQPIDALTLTAGLRVDDHNTFGSVTTGRAAIAYNPDPQWTFRASWGQGFKAPTLFQLSGGGFATPNPNLQPETSESIDAGIDWRSRDGRLSASLTVFDSMIEDMISYAPTGYFNEAEVDTHGVEISGRVQLTRSTSIDLSYGYLEATDTDGNPLIRLPEHSGDVRLSFDPDGPFSGTVLVRYNGEEPNSATTQVEEWTRVDVSGSYDVNERWEVFGRVENLFDEDYQQVLGYGTPDLSGYVGIRLRY